MKECWQDMSETLVGQIWEGIAQETENLLEESEKGNEKLVPMFDVVSRCLSSSSDDHDCSHSCLGTGMRVGT